MSNRGPPRFPTNFTNFNKNFNANQLPNLGRLNRYLGIIAVLGGTTALAASSLFTVQPGHAAVVFNRIWGTKEYVYPSGTHLRLPLLEKVIDYNMRSKAKSIGSPTGSKDLQMINITVRVLYRPVFSTLPTLYKTLGTDYDERVLPSIINEETKAVVAQFNASQLVERRENVSRLIRDRLTDRAKDFFITLDDVSITHLSFSKEYAAAVENKLVAQQAAERAKYIVEKAEQEKREAIVKAEGEAESAKLISDAIKQDPNFITLRKLEAAREIAKNLAKSNNKVYLDSDNLLFSLYDSSRKDKK